ncbi:MAG: sigma-70 family RNA polymerase sigma factor [Oscillospiraceae bacterium]|nr:sigma-70 family RNA polymerase sigma factor [Oscillospiraceae bacterium]
MEYDLLSEQVFEDMYHEYFPKIYNYIFYRILSREDTEDIVSDIFLKVAKNARSFDPDRATFATWIYNIAKNTLTDHYRQKKVMCVSYEDADAASIADVEAQLKQINSDRRKVIFKELSLLKEKERLVIYYKYFEGYSNRQIADLLDMNESTVGTVLSRSLKKLRTDNMLELNS